MTGGYFVALGLDQLGASPLQPGDPSEVGSFRIFARLAVGGMGRVYLARDPATSGLAAVKVLRSEYAEDADFRTRFEREVATVRLAQGAHIVTLLGSEFDGDLLWIATGYLPGISLTDAVAQFGPLDPRSAWRLVGDLAAAVGTVAEVGVVHRDVKPSNVVLTGDGAYLIDFGISQAADMSGITKTGVAVGTPAFMSPEQVSGKKTGTPSDVFSLASVVAYAVTRHAPFGDSATVDVLHRIAYEPPNSDVLEQIAELDPELAELIGRCLEKDEAARPSPSELAEAVSSHGSPAEWPAPISELIRVREIRCAAVSVPDGPAAVETAESESTPSTVAKSSAETAEIAEIAETAEPAEAYSTPTALVTSPAQAQGPDSTPTTAVKQVEQTPSPDGTPTMAVRPALPQPKRPDTPGGSTREIAATEHPATRNRKRAALVGVLSAITLATAAAAAVVAYGAGGGRPAVKPTAPTQSHAVTVTTGLPTSAGPTTADTAGDSYSPAPTKHTSATATTPSATATSLPTPSSSQPDLPSTTSGSATPSDSPATPVSTASATSNSPTAPATSTDSVTPTSPPTSPTSTGPSSDASPPRESTSGG
jgi:serine/threonine protein kinase